ncbi:MAG: hypothetical protein QG608_3223 [Actinomycetota bacterium]|nr:hypothetical protein [Actinomycetota bacterium]
MTPPRRPQVSGSDAAIRVCGVLGLVAALLYAAFLFRWGSGGLDAQTSYVSELSARDQPGSSVFRATDIVSGALISILALGLWWRLGPNRWAAVGCGSVAVFGLATVGVGMLPLDCAVTADAACHEAELAGRLSLGHQAHTVVSVIAATASLVGLGVLSRPLRHVHGWRPVGLLGLATLPIVAGLCLVMTVLDLQDDQVGQATALSGYLGVFQRVQLVLLTVWISALALALLLDGRHGPGNRCSTVGADPCPPDRLEP